MAARRPSYAALGVAMLGIAAATALFLLGGRSEPPPAPPELIAIAADLDTKLKETAAGLKSRASTIADLPRLGAAVATDAATVEDLTQEELAFRLKPGETIEIAQVTKGGQAISLLRIPKGAQAAPPMVTPGSALSAAPGGLLASEVVNITPTVETGIHHGALAVSWFVDARPFLERIDVLGIPARIVLDGATVATAGGTMPADAPTVSVPLAGGRAGIVAAAPDASGGLSPMRISGLVVGALSLLFAGLLWRRRPAAESSSLPYDKTTPSLPSLSKPYSPAAEAAAKVMAHNGGSQQPTGAVFGRYTLVRKLGTGGMAEVYLARVAGEAGFQRDVALKIMHPNLASMPEVVDHFLDEARLASRLSHPNIVQIYDLGRSGEDYYIAMEYIDGYDLDFLLDSGSARGAPIPVRVTLAIVRKVCDGLHAAHTAVTAEGAPLDLVHRDVKAENVLISRKGEVKVADFGIAKANQRVRQTQLGMVKGTAAYMAPEHRVGKPVDRRADVYGVGAILYELLTGTQINLDLENLAHLGKEGWPHLTPPSQVRGDLPQEIDALVFKALAFDREDRYPTCAAMEDALEQFAVRHALEVGDKIVVAWIEKEIAFAEARAAQGGAAS